MKPIITLLAFMLLVASCSKDDATTPKPFKVNANDKISISPASGVRSATIGHLSALDIVKQTTEISLIYYETQKPAGRSFIKEQRDTISATPKLLMWATDVIGADDAGNLAGQLMEGWITAKDVVFVRYPYYEPNKRDTIAYILNSVLRTAETAIRAAYSAKDIDACYKIFNEAYTFTPITGAEWRALKAQGTN